MKYSFLLLAILLGLGFNSVSQVVVKVRPVKPKVLVVKPKRSNSANIWVEGHWKWNGKKNRYVRRKGHWDKKEEARLYSWTMEGNFKRPRVGSR